MQITTITLHLCNCHQLNCFTLSLCVCKILILFCRESTWCFTCVNCKVRVCICCTDSLSSLCICVIVCFTVCCFPVESGGDKYIVLFSTFRLLNLFAVISVCLLNAAPRESIKFLISIIELL